MELASSLYSHQECSPNYPSACSKGGYTQDRGGQLYSGPSGGSRLLSCKKQKKDFERRDFLSSEMRANSQVLIEV